jgi:hypothetical protein
MSTDMNIDLTEENKKAELMYRNPEYMKACRDTEFWRAFYNITGDWTVGMWARPPGEVKRAEEMIGKTLVVYRMLKNENYDTTIRLIRDYTRNRYGSQ